MPTAEEIIRALGLQPHPLEGGYFRETFHDSFGTAIYYLLTGAGVSEMHKLPGAEVYHHYLGDPLETLLLHPDGSGEVVIVGSDVSAGQRPQLVIPGGVWQGSTRIAGPHGFTLIGATMAPGFAYSDYVRGARKELGETWPAFAERIALRTPNG
jgi:predicted cupin superfamily sugar epimerase